MDDRTWQEGLAWGRGPAWPAEAQRRFRALDAPFAGQELRGEWRRALLRRMALNRCAAGSARERLRLDGLVDDEVLFEGVTITLDALRRGEAQLYVRDAEADLSALSEHLDLAVWGRAFALIVGCEQGLGLLSRDGVGSRLIRELVERGEVEAAKGLLQHVRWRRDTVQAVQALWPHGDAEERAAWLAHADAALADSPLPPVYNVEPMADLCRLAPSAERLAALEALMASLAPNELEASQDFDDPRVSFLLACHAAGQRERAEALAAELPPDWVRTHGWMELAEQAAEPDRSRYLELAVAAAFDTPQLYAPTLAALVKAHPPAAPRALRWALDGLEGHAAEGRDPVQDAATLLPVLSGAAGDELATALLAARPRWGEHTDDVLAALGEIGLWLDRAVWSAEAPDPVESPWWWRTVMPALRPAERAAVAEIIIQAYDPAVAHYTRETFSVLLAEFLLDQPAEVLPWWIERIAPVAHLAVWSTSPLTRFPWAREGLPLSVWQALPQPRRLQVLVAERRALMRHRDRWGGAGALWGMVWLLPWDMLARHADAALQTELGREHLNRVADAAEDFAIAPPLSDDDPMTPLCRARWSELLTSPGPGDFHAVQELGAIAARLGGEALLEELWIDVLAWLSGGGAPA